MDFNEMLFALQIRQATIKEMEEAMPESMSGLRRKQFMEDNFDGYMLDILEHVQRVARTIQSHNEG